METITDLEKLYCVNSKRLGAMSLEQIDIPALF